jgi:hypothetical protein
MKYSRLLALAALVTINVGCASSKSKREESKVVGFAIIYPIQYPSKSVPVEANRTSIFWGKHDYVQGADLGFVGNFTDKEFAGSALAIGFNVTRGKAHILAIQMAGLTNANLGATKIEGFQVALGVNYTGGNQSVYGLQLAGLGNIGKGNKVYGFQVGLYNEAEAIYGFQIGAVNRTKNLYGIQVGALNFYSNNGLPFFPVINIGF